MVTTCKERWHGFRRKQWETTVREKMGRTLWSLAKEVMVKILSGGMVIEGDNVREDRVWIQERQTIQCDEA